jgi:hypothetical protein
MSTKNLARTVIEGGRRHGNCWFRRHSHGVHRALEREALGRYARIDELDGLIVPSRRHVHRQFADKLGPAGRWLERQAGRPWDLVRGELFERFDIRTTPGRHIVFCHILPWVEDSRGGSRRTWFEIDAHGILRQHRRKQLRYGFYAPALPRPEHELEAWLAGRRVGERGGFLFWFTPTSTGAYRQHQRLDDSAAALWRSLPASYRERHDPAASPADPRKRS